MNSRDLQVIGLCRFSYPALGGFQVDHETPEDRIAYLYSEARLGDRFRHFEAVALPCLREQTDPEFHLVVLIGDSLPKHHVDRLHDLTAGLAHVTIRAEPPAPHRDIMKQVLNDARLDMSAPCLQFRFDDDDAISVDFVERLRETAGDCYGLLDKHPSTAIDFNRGFVAEFSADGIAASPTFRPYFTAAMGMYVRGGATRSIMNFAHQKIHQHMPTITLTDAPMWVRSHNAWNDSRQKKVAAVDVASLTPELEGEFAARFALDVDLVKRVFGDV